MSMHNERQATSNGILSRQSSASIQRIGPTALPILELKKSCFRDRAPAGETPASRYAAGTAALLVGYILPVEALASRNRRLPAAGGVAPDEVGTTTNPTAGRRRMKLNRNQ